MRQSFVVRDSTISSRIRTETSKQLPEL